MSIYEVDLDQFWHDDEQAHRNNTFFAQSPQIALGIRMSDECVFAELDEPGDPWGHTPRERRLELNKRYNDKAQRIVGRRLLSESLPAPSAVFPPVRRIGEVFAGQYHFGSQTGEWLDSPIETPKQLELILDRVDRIDIREFMLPENWESEKRKIYENHGIKPPLLRHVRGPVTLAMSIFGAENLIFLYYDAPELYERFSQSILRTILEMSRIMDEEAGFLSEQVPAGFSFADDDCCLLTSEMYELFGYPVLRGVFDHYSPNEDDQRYQHSDSDMAHLLPILARVNLTGCNFGPTVLPDRIRAYMPRTRIDGCLAPFTFMRNNAVDIAAEVERDCRMIKQTGTRGLNLTTAGSINNGSLLESMRVVMAAIQTYGRY